MRFVFFGEPVRAEAEKSDFVGGFAHDVDEIVPPGGAEWRMRRRGLQSRPAPAAALAARGDALRRSLRARRARSRRGLGIASLLLRKQKILSTHRRKAMRDQMRRWIFGKSSQTFTPQKCEPSVQIGVEIPARK